MYSSVFALSFAAQALGYAVQSYDYPALPMATDQPLGVTYQATLQPGKPGQGYFTGTTNDNGTGVHFNIGLTELNDQGPFSYHIHMNQVPEDGNCTAAGPHVIQPGGPADGVPCNTTAPQFCQIGDLSGKHGKIVAENGKYNTEYLDAYVAAAEDNMAFFGNRSIVLHNSNGTRINCANFVLQSNATGPSHAGNTTATHSQPSVTATGSSSSSNGAAAPPSQSSPSESSPTAAPGDYSGNGGSSLHSSVSLLVSMGMVGLVAAVWL